jgi:hypothetical protein
MTRFLIAAIGFILTVQGAVAAEPVFPPASRVGIVPLQDMVLSRRFSGFENSERATAITFSEMPPEAYDELVSGLTKDALKRQGIAVTARENLKVGASPGLLISGEMTGRVKGRKWVLAVKGADVTALLIAQVEGGADGYSEQQMRQALTSVAIRAPVSLDEQISALPFRIGDKAGFRPVRVLAGNSVLLTEGPLDTIKALEQPVVIMAISLTPPPQEGVQRDRFARAALVSNQTIKDVAVERAEAFRLKGQEWHEIVARAVDAASGQPIIVMQTIRFEGDRYVRMVGIARVADRGEMLPRFRNLIDAVDMAP